MSQICPSSSHQLVAAAIAFRRARRKFPKNYGLCCNSEEVTKFDETESITGNEETNDAENLSFTPRKCLNTMSNCVEPVAVWNDESGESSSFKENLLQIPIICSCCRKRNEQGSGGDALDIVPSKEHNGIARKIECFKAEQSESNDGKAMKGFITESRNSSRCRTSYSHSGRRSPKETSSKLDSVNLLYDRGHDDVDKDCNAGEHSCSGGRRDCKSAHRNSRSKLNVSESRKDNVLPNVSHDCDFHCAKHSTMNLLGSHTDCCQSQNSHRCYHSHEHCHHHCYEKCSCTAKGKPRLTSDTCLCSSNLNDHAVHCNKDHVPCNHGCCTKGLKKISLVQEQKDEELDDCVGTIHHKDSLCILVEKYKANRKCKIKKCADEAEISDERIKDDKSFTSETTCQLEDINSKQREKHSDNKHRFRGKTCRHGCGQVIRDGDYNHIKNLKSRLIKTGTCCSPKGTPWRHTFYV
ncbi:uncharacterized protein LOC100874826 isoform X2 [Megachile rotundata]|uniref:uncharacterized protein LOC100874826 isoform X2 n=1 Tax=Megachile rotundata TaxID=143995 RepID=UPI0006150804|nr:PREDICTED: uncharacterized protein LOC100874826 isoform X2 [Megachile rotundata]